jgi:hypothetical protein
MRLALLVALVRRYRARRLLDELAADEVARATVVTVARLPPHQRESLLRLAR